MASTPKIDVNVAKYICHLCGTAYVTRNGYFYKSYAQTYKGTGYLHICKSCVDDLYEDFLRLSKDPRIACHAVCRKLNLYWDDAAYDGVLKGSSKRTIMSGYLTRMSAVKYRGKSYDDYLRELGMLWEIPSDREEITAPLTDYTDKESESNDIEIAEDVRTAWGPGYTNKQYAELEARRNYWMHDLASRGVDVNDVGVGALLRQIVATEIEINKGRANGEDVDKKVNTFNTLIGNAILKPSQKKSDADVSIDNTPLGVWIRRYENELPLPRDENESQIKKFVHTWLYGHLCKMLGIRNSYTQMYEDEMSRLRVEKPEYADEDDDYVITDAFGEDVFDDG